MILHQDHVLGNTPQTTHIPCDPALLSRTLALPACPHGRRFSSSCYLHCSPSSWPSPASQKKPNTPTDTSSSRMDKYLKGKSVALVGKRPSAARPSRVTLSWSATLHSWDLSSLRTLGPCPPPRGAVSGEVGTGRDGRGPKQQRAWGTGDEERGRRGPLCFGARWSR